MADLRITELTEYTGTVADTDVLEMVDASDPTDNAAGSSFKVTKGTLLAGDINAVETLKFSAAPSSPLTTEGSVYYDATNKTLAVKNNESAVTLQVGQENWVRVYNATGSLIPDGSVVYITGKEDVENRATIGLALADAANTSQVIGMATHDIGIASFGFVTQFGEVGSLDTSAFADGAAVWLSDTVAGGLTDVKPQAPSNAVFIGWILDSHVSTGNLFFTTVGNTSGTTVAGQATELTVPCRKNAAGTITKGECVYIVGYNASGYALVELADSDSSATMPALGIASDTFTNSTTGTVTTSGRVGNLDTSAYTANQSLYVSGTAGALTSTKPVGAALIQSVARVVRAHATQGVVQVVGAGRSNDIPNFTAADTYWYGGTSGVATEGTITTAGRALLDDADAAAQRTTLGADITSANDVDDLTNIVATNQTGTTYTLALTDAHSMVYCSNAAQVTVTIPTNASVAFANGTRVVLLSTGAGGLTLTTTSLTLLGSSPKKTIVQNEAIYLEKVATDTWAIIGGTAA